MLEIAKRQGVEGPLTPLLRRGSIESLRRTLFLEFLADQFQFP